ncbi:unnamed protein product [Acidocella sp. C78]|nr:unnamed protein product [Acidocella sp. C78]
MKPFADLLERLLYTTGRNAKIALLADYFVHRPDPERGYALAAIAGALDFPGAKPAMLRELAAARTDPELFALSYDFVGDLAETIALLWPPARHEAPPGLPDLVAALRAASRAEIPALIEAWLDASDVSTRIALIKLITGGLRVGASLRLAKLALARHFAVEADEIEEVWHGLEPPYTALFDWLEGRAPRPAQGAAPVFRPPMLAHRSRRPISPRSTGPPIAPNGNGTASASSSSPPRAGGGSIRAGRKTSPRPSPKSSRRWISTPCSMASCWSSAMARSPPSPISSSASTARASRRNSAPPTRSACGCMTCCSRAKPTFAHCPSMPAAPGSKPGSPAPRRRGWTCPNSSASPRPTISPPFAPARATPRSRG